MTLEDETEATARRLLAAARAAGAVISGDFRVSETVAAGLLGIAPGTLRNLRLAGNGPRVFHTPINNSSYSYRLDDLASWIQVGRRQV